MTVNFAPGDLVRARGREWVALPAPREGILALRPLSGSENDMVILDPGLEMLPVEAARFDLPDDASPTVQSKAALLADALRLTLRRGAGPFRSAAQLAFEPRTYQLVPLLMALRLPVVRLLIADDVGIGKTIEAGLILRELMDRGEVDAFSVLCPPHLVEQWVLELKNRFGIEAVAVTSGTAVRLERGLPLAQTLFDAYPYTVVSLDYIKADKRREGFARACPDFVIVDEAHACVGTHKGKQQRFELLSGLARDPDRRIVMLTATPHSGDEQAFARLLSLIDPSFASMDFEDARFRERLARHLVQRRRIDITSGEWGEDRAFPRKDEMEGGLPYRLSKDHLAFQEAVLDYCFGVVFKAGTGQRERRLAFWGTLALMRCVGSSPAAALSALRNRASNESERLEPQIYDEDGDDEDAVDIEPSANFDADPALLALVQQAEELVEKPDPKLSALIDVLTPLIKKGANPVIFCRYLATAEHVRAGLRKAFPKLKVEAVTGVLTPDERRDRVADMAPAEDEKDIQRILVATDCLSEGINLQQLFDTVIHYDLSWNPTRHEQRAGRALRVDAARLQQRLAMQRGHGGVGDDEGRMGLRQREFADAGQQALADDDGIAAVAQVDADLLHGSGGGHAGKCKGGRVALPQALALAPCAGPVSRSLVSAARNRAGQLQLRHDQPHQRGQAGPPGVHGEVRRLAVQRVPLRMQGLQARQRVLHLQQGALAVMLDPLVDLLRRRAQVDHLRVRPQGLAVGLAQHHAATGGQHDALLRGEVANHVRFALAKAGLAFDFKNQGNGRAGTRLDLMISIDKTLVQSFGQCATYRGLARAHQADKENIGCRIQHASWRRSLVAFGFQRKTDSLSHSLQALASVMPSEDGSSSQHHS